MPLHVSSTMCSSSGGQNYYTASGIIALSKKVAFIQLYYTEMHGQQNIKIPNACFCLRFLVSVLVLFFLPFFFLILPYSLYSVFINFSHTFPLMLPTYFLFVPRTLFPYHLCFPSHILASFNVYFRGSVYSRYLTAIKITRCISETRISIEVNFEKAA